MRGMHTGGMVELYETCLIWMVDTATTSLHLLCMTIYQAKNFFVPNNCIPEEANRAGMGITAHHG
jgi:hypothetical protein